MYDGRCNFPKVETLIVVSVVVFVYIEWKFFVYSVSQEISLRDKIDLKEHLKNFLKDKNCLLYYE